MNSIDIIDPQFSLNLPDSLIVADSLHVPDSSILPDVNEISFTDNPIDPIIGGESSKKDYTMFIYIAIAIFLGLLGMFLYKKYVENRNRKNNNNYVQDCPGGFCTMNSNRAI